MFTDGRFYLSDDGKETKAFNTQDGYGIRMLLGAGIQVAVISGRKSPAAAKRMTELGVQHAFFGCGNKVSIFDELAADLKIPHSAALYVGDDLPDLPLLTKVGVAVAVANAVPDIKLMADYVTVKSGGYGAVREICELILDEHTAADV